MGERILPVVCFPIQTIGGKVGNGVTNLNPFGDGLFQAVVLIDAHGDGGAGGIGGFGNLHLDERMIQVIPLGQLVQPLRHIHGENVDPADVYGNRHRLNAAVDHVPQPDEDLLPEIGIQVGDDAVLFQHGDEDRRGQAGPVGALPAGQRFAADDPAGLDIDLGLDMEGDLPARKGSLKVGQELELDRKSVV